VKYCKMHKYILISKLLQTKVMLIENRIVKIEEVVYQTGEKKLVNQEDMISEFQKMGKDLKRELDTSFKKIRDEMIGVVSVKIGNDLKAKMDIAFKKAKDELFAERTDGKKDDVVFSQLQKDMGEMKTILDNNVKHVKEDVEETLEIERRKLNIIIHGVPEKVEKDTDSVEKILSEGLIWILIDILKKL